MKRNNLLKPESIGKKVSIRVFKNGMVEKSYTGEIRDMSFIVQTEQGFESRPVTVVDVEPGVFIVLEEEPKQHVLHLPDR